MAVVSDVCFISGQRFYLDLKQHKKEPEIRKGIAECGGKIDSFLSKDIQCVITDRNEALFEAETSYRTPYNDGHGSNMPKNVGASKSGSVCSPTPSVSFSDCGRGAMMSRGQALVQKAKQMNREKQDVLEICHQWNVKVVHVETFELFLYKRKMQMRAELEKKLQTKRQQKDFSTSCRRKLCYPFLKVEDVEQQYKPLYKELLLHDQVFGSSVFKACNNILEDYKRGKLKDTSSVPEEVHVSSSQGPINVNFTEVIQKNFSSSIIKKPFCSKIGHKGDSKENAPQMAPFPLPAKRKRVLKSSENVLKCESQPFAKFCELCRRRYDDEVVHLSSARHQSSMKTTEYQELADIVDSMPLQNFLQKVWLDRMALKKKKNVGISEPSQNDPQRLAEGKSEDVMSSTPLQRYYQLRLKMKEMDAMASTPLQKFQQRLAEGKSEDVMSSTPLQRYYQLRLKMKEMDAVASTPLQKFPQRLAEGKSEDVMSSTPLQRYYQLRLKMKEMDVVASTPLQKFPKRLAVKEKVTKSPAKRCRRYANDFELHCEITHSNSSSQKTRTIWFEENYNYQAVPLPADNNEELNDVYLETTEKYISRSRSSIDSDILPYLKPDVHK